MLLTLLVGLRTCASFLTSNHPIKAEVLVVEGWLPDYVLEDAKSEFEKGNYRFIITIGSPLPKGYYRSRYGTSAVFAASTLADMGLATNLIVPVSAPLVLRDRTLQHARALKAWIDAHGAQIDRVNLYSMGAHARRTWLVFERVLGKRVKVGIIAHPDSSYELEAWWKTSEGLRTVAGEAIAYLWAKVIG